MKSFLAVLAAAVGSIVLAGPACAQASRTWVSGVGDDVNPCSRTAPCKTFAGAISKTAVNGEINCLDPGGFGAVTITKSITIDCHGTLGSILNAGTNGINIAFDSFAATDVRKTVNVRNVMIQGFDSGIIGIRIFGVGTGSFVNIEDCLVNGNFGSTATGIADQRSSGKLAVLNTTVRDMGGNGISVASAGVSGQLLATLDNVRVINTNRAIAAGARSAVHVNRSVLANNFGAGVSVVAGSETNINSTTIASNVLGIQAVGTVRLSNSDVSTNDVGISGTVNSFSNNRFTDNGAGGTISPIGSTTNPTGQQ